MQILSFFILFFNMNTLELLLMKAQASCPCRFLDVADTEIPIISRTTHVLLQSEDLTNHSLLRAPGRPFNHTSKIDCFLNLINEFIGKSASETLSN